VAATKDLDEVYSSGAYGVHTIEHKTACGGVDEVDDVVEAAAKLVNVFTVKRGDEGLIELGEEGVVISSPSCSMALTICTCSGRRCSARAF